MTSNSKEESWHGVVIAKPDVATVESRTGRILPVDEIMSVNVGDHVIVNVSTMFLVSTSDSLLISLFHVQAQWGESISQTIKIGDRHFALQPAEKIIAVVKE